MSNPVPTLDDLRREIDRIDAAMHGLLMERGAIIDRLIAVKRTSESGSAFRPGREADMMRRLVARHEGRLPFSAIEHIWRTIISTFTHVQAPYRVHVAAEGREGEMRDLARFQMGFDVPMAMYPQAQAAVDAVSASAGDLGLVPLGTEGSEWWEGLGEPGAPQVMARLPFLAYPDRPADTPALVIAKPLGDAAVAEVTVAAVPAESYRAEQGEVLARGRHTILVALAGPLPQGGRRVGSYAAPIVPDLAPKAHATVS